MEEIFTREDFQKLFRKLWKDRGYSISEGEHIGVPIKDLVEHSAERNAKIKSDHIDLWVAILDEHISWFISLATVIWNKPSKNDKVTNFEKCVFLVLSKIISDTTALRHLILLGFDTSARAILRSVAEYLEILVALIHEPTLADEFVKTDTPENAQAFWMTHLRGGKIRKRVTEAWLDFLGRENRETAEWFSNWGRNSIPMLSGLAHPSLGGGLFSAIPLKSQYPDEPWMGFFGDKAESSIDTIFIYLQFVFPVLLLNRSFPFGMGAPHFRIKRRYKKSDELHRHVKIGRDVLASLILSLSKEENSRHVFPEIDMSIWPSADDTPLS